MAHWSAQLWESAQPQGLACEVTLRDDTLVAQLPDGREVQLPLGTLVCERQGFEATSYGLHPVDAPVPLLITREPGLLAALRAHPASRNALKAERARSRRKGL